MVGAELGRLLQKAFGEGVGMQVVAVSALALVLLGLAGCHGTMLDGLIFFPDRDMPPPPAGIAERRFVAVDGVGLHAWWAGPVDAPAVLLWSHGNAGNVANREPIVQAFAARGVGVLAYDYRGYGRSEGRPDEAGVYRDAEAAFDALVAAGVPPSRIVCFGESLGGAVSLRLASVRPCAGVAVVATFPALRDVARVHYGPLGVFACRRFDTQPWLAALRVPLLVAHGDHDEIVPFALGERLFAAARAPKRFVAVRGRSHNDVLDDVRLQDAVVAFAREVARG